MFEVGHGDIRPEVTIQVHHDVVDAAQVVKHGGKVVVVGYLGGVLFPLYFQFFGEELVGKCSPVDLRVSHVVGVEVPGGTSEFTGTSYFFQ